MATARSVLLPYLRFASVMYAPIPTATATAPPSRYMARLSSFSSSRGHHQHPRRCPHQQRAASPCHSLATYTTAAAVAAAATTTAATGMTTPICSCSRRCRCGEAGDLEYLGGCRCGWLFLPSSVFLLVLLPRVLLLPLSHSLQFLSLGEEVRELLRLLGKRGRPSPGEAPSRSFRTRS